MGSNQAMSRTIPSPSLAIAEPFLLGKASTDAGLLVNVST